MLKSQNIGKKFELQDEFSLFCMLPNPVDSLLGLGCDIQFIDTRAFRFLTLLR